MKKLFHISDMHFGKIDETIVASLLVNIKNEKPDLIIISGDLTQRATESEFTYVQAFLLELKNLKLLYIVIPGNHDIEPLFKPLRRLANPYKNYKKFISHELEPVYFDNEIVVGSINTSRSKNIKDGKINIKQIERMETWFSLFPNNLIKILVTHHPIDLPLTHHAHKLVPHANVILHEFSKQKIDIYLSGHYHASSVITTSERNEIKNYSAIALQAGTLSLRERGEGRSFNILYIESLHIKIETFVWNSEEKKFISHITTQFQNIHGTWVHLKK